MYGQIPTGADAGIGIIPGPPSRVIHKFNIPIDDQWHGVTLPQGANLIHVGNTTVDKNLDYVSNESRLHFWVEISNTPAYMAHHEFRVYGTGQPIIEPRARWAGTFIEGGFVWHLYMMPGA